MLGIKFRIWWRNKKSTCGKKDNFNLKHTSTCGLQIKIKPKLPGNIGTILPESKKMREQISIPRGNLMKQRIIFGIATEIKRTF